MSTDKRPAADETTTPRLSELRAQTKLAQISALAAISVGKVPAPVNLTIYQGDDFFLHVAVDDTATPGIDLSTYIPKAEIRAAAGATSVLATFVATIYDFRTVALHLTSTQSALLQGNAFWDVQITDPAGLVTTLAAGTVTIVKQVTQ